ncbi:MAG: cysteine hydrolase [Chloroflexi bacterium]|jgi:nicotinamidase-related amidase|nr:cysteine hydrolase [Chloroflexota bacterium]
MAQESGGVGNAPVALLLIDVINDLEWDGGEQILPQAREMAEKLSALKQRCREHGIPAIYVNDNFGQWQSDFRRLVEHVLQDGVRGEYIARHLAPADDDYFVLKPLHSGFYQTTLSTLLDHLETTTLIIAGMATDYCVLFTGADAYMRGFKIHVPPDCCAANRAGYHEQALALMARVLKADLTPSDELDLDSLAESDRAERASVGGEGA